MPSDCLKSRFRLLHEGFASSSLLRGLWLMVTSSPASDGHRARFQTRPGTDQADSPVPFWRRKLVELFGIDLTTLAFFRICISLVLLWNLATRAVDMGAMYTDDGVMPTEAVRAYYGESWRWSLHLLHGSVVYQSVLFLVAALFALALLIGFHTRLATIASWLLLISLHTRAPMLLTGGDVLLSMLLFWGMFLPLGGQWSLDRLRGAGPPVRDRPAISVASVAILLQVCFMYWFTGVWKYNDIWLEGAALENALALDMLVRPVGRVLLQFPQLLRYLSFATLWLELVGPFLFFCPFGTRYVRTATVLAFALLHLGIELSMSVLIFSFVSLAALTLFLPGTVWQVRWVRWTTGGVAKGVGKLLPAFLAGPGPARRRRSLPQPVAATLRVARECFCLFFLIYVFGHDTFMLASRRAEVADALPSGLRWLAETCARHNWIADLTVCHQRWDMFASPTGNDYRFVAVARLENDRFVDAMRGIEIHDMEQPEQLSAKAPSGRWMLFLMELSGDHNYWFRPYLAEYLARRWNERRAGSERIVALKLYLHHLLAEPDPLGNRTQTLLLAEVDPLARGPYRNGKKEGHWTIRYEDGQLQAEGTYHEGQEHGRWTYRLPDGSPEAEGSYRDGRMTGRWVFWQSDGTRKERTFEPIDPFAQNQ